MKEESLKIIVKNKLLLVSDISDNYKLNIEQLHSWYLCYLSISYRYYSYLESKFNLNCFTKTLEPHDLRIPNLIKISRPPNREGTQNFRTSPVAIRGQKSTIRTKMAEWRCFLRARNLNENFRTVA